MGQPASRTSDPHDEHRRWIAFAVLAAVAGGTLLMGAALSTSAPGSRPTTLEAGMAIETPPAAQQLEATGEMLEPIDPGWPAAGAMDRLAERTASDLERMANDPRGWTRQLAVLCDTSSVESLLAGNELDSLRLLPAYVDDRTCFRLCWGGYESREQASAAVDMPAHLRQEFPDSIPRSRDEVLE